LWAVRVQNKDVVASCRFGEARSNARLISAARDSGHVNGQATGDFDRSFSAASPIANDAGRRCRPRRRSSFERRRNFERKHDDFVARIVWRRQDLVADGTKSRELDALLILEPERLVVRNRDNGSILQAPPYQSIAAATYTRSKQPRWQEDGSVAPIPKSFSGSGFFLKSSRHWLTLQSKTEFVILRLEDKNFRMVLESVEARAGLKVQQPAARD
jgi:hypothetical protein